MVEIRDQVLELQESLVNVKEQAIELMQQNQELRKRLQVNSELQHDEDGNIFWRMDSNKKRGPYCSTCYGVGEKFISLSKMKIRGYGTVLSVKTVSIHSNGIKNSIKSMRTCAENTITEIL